MCGRTCCTLSPDLLPYACSTIANSNGSTILPKWNNPADEINDCERNEKGKKYRNYSPSTNIAPTAFTPVLLSMPSNLQKFDYGNKNQETYKIDANIVLDTMMWGLIPPWHRSDTPKGHGLTTNNARIETIKESKLYKPSLENNQRCVVICDGFYEWKTFKDNSKQPYIIYAKQNCLMCKAKSECRNSLSSHTCQIQTQSVEDLSKHWKDGDGWSGQKPLFMAGIYSKWYPTLSSVYDTKLKCPVNSYTIITRESGNIMKWIHHRMPLFLFNTDDVTLWLDPKVSSFDAIDILSKRQDEEKLSWHPVSPSVGAIKNQADDLILKVELNSDGKAVNKSTKKSANIMLNWLKPGVKPGNAKGI